MFLSRSFAFAFASFCTAFVVCVWSFEFFICALYVVLVFFFLPTNFSFGFPGHDDTHHGRDTLFTNESAWWVAYSSGVIAFLAPLGRCKVFDKKFGDYETFIGDRKTFDERLFCIL